MTLNVLLPRRGWTVVKKTKSYIYVIPPSDQIKPPFHISIAIPTPQECLEIARRSYVKGKSWMGQLGEFPACYLHERNTNVQEIWRDPSTGEMQTRLHQSPPESSLSIGQYGVWSTVVSGVAGNFKLPHNLSLSPGESDPEADLADDSGLLEGGLKLVELTSYERNPEARRRCIEHYGARCQACGLNYGDKYGCIGRGLIHVHHITPLSAIGESYQVDPVHDLVPLCACCHHVAHRRNPPYSVAEIRTAIEGQALRIVTAMGRPSTEFGAD